MSQQEHTGTTSHGSVVNIFDGFRAELDDYSDRRERLIKVSGPSFIARHSTHHRYQTFRILQASRDVTSLSKKIIFLLHRVMTEDTEDTDRSQSQRAATAGRDKLAEVTDIYAGIKHEIAGDRFWRYYKCFSPGMQEFIEALSFLHYLEHGNLITYDEVQRTLSDDHGVPVRMSVTYCPSSSI